MENRESTRTARVFFKRGGAPGKPGRYFYQFEGEEPEGPFDTELEAGKAARAVIIGAAQVARATEDRRSGGDQRRGWGDHHFAGRDRRMIERRRSPRRMVGADRTAGEPVTDPHPDQRLDRVRGRNKYAVVNMRQVADLDGPAQATVLRALNTLRVHAVLNDGDAGTKGEFFVLMLRDKFADLALLAYQAAARRAGMESYADDVLQLSTRAGPGSTWCKLPD